MVLNKRVNLKETVIFQPKNQTNDTYFDLTHVERIFFFRIVTFLIVRQAHIPLI